MEKELKKYETPELTEMLLRFDGMLCQSPRDFSGGNESYIETDFEW